MNTPTPHLLPTSHPSLISTLGVTLGILAVLASTSVLQAATRTWDGETSNVLSTATNWSDNTLPTGSGDTALWNGTQAGNLSLTWTAAWTWPNTGNIAGAHILVASTQTGSLTMTGNTRVSINSFTVENGAGAVSFGVGSGSFVIAFRGGSSFTNNSANTVTFGSNITGWENGGGAPRDVVFGGSGNWQIDGNYGSTPTGSGANSLIKDGIGTLTFNGSQNGWVSGGTPTGTSLEDITINQGTVKFGASAQLTTYNSPTGTYTSTILNDGTFEWASSANQILSGVISGAGALVQSGAGTLTLTKTNTYTGDTAVTAGTLLLGTGGSIADSTLVELNAGATFDTTAQSFTMLSSQTFNFTIDAAGSGSAGLFKADTLDITDGVVTFDTVGILDDDVYILANYGSLVGSGFASVTAPDGYLIDYNYLGGNQIALVVPEPNAIALFLGSLGFIAIFCRRRATTF